jgi:AcrR family transcriptional regulator
MGRKNLSTQRRKEIIVAFYEVARNLGLENTSIDKVAKHLKLTKGLILHYFKNREELLIGLNEYILEQHLQLMASSTETEIDSREKLIDYIQQLFSRKWNKYFDDGVFYSCYALIYRIPSFRKSFRAYLEELHRVLLSVLQQASENGIINGKRLPEKTEVMFALVDGAYYYMGMYEESEDLYREKINLYCEQSLVLLELS